MSLVFYDWEFYEDGKTITPISLGLVAEDGRELYLINGDFDWDRCPNEWLHENVEPYVEIEGQEVVTLPQSKIGDRVLKWLKPETEKPEEIQFIGYYSAYDHVLLAQQFGTMMDLPSAIPMYTRDLKQWCSDLGNPELPPQSATEHNALFDARWIRSSYQWLTENYVHPAWAWKHRLKIPGIKL